MPTSDSAVLSFLNAFLTSPYFKDPILILSILQISVKDSFLYKAFLADSATKTTSPSSQLIQTPAGLALSSSCCHSHSMYTYLFN